MIVKVVNNSGCYAGDVCFDDFQQLMERLNVAFPFLVCYQTYDDSLHVDDSILFDVLFNNF